MCIRDRLRTRVKTPEATKAAKDISLRRKPVYQGDLDDIEMYFMATVKEIKKMCIRDSYRSVLLFLCCNRQGL